jgi:hypothetical protein
MERLKCTEYLGFSHIYAWFVAKAETYLLIFILHLKMEAIET